MLDGIDEEWERLGYRVLIASAGSRPRGEERALGAFLECRTDGIVLVGPRVPSRTITDFAASVPVVVVARGIRSAFEEGRTEAVHVRLTSELVVRSSTGPPNPDRARL